MKIHKLLLTSAIALSGLSVTSCAVDDTMMGTGPIVDTTTFNIVSFTPDYNTTTSEQTETIVAAFSMPVEPSSLIGNFELTQDINGIATDLTQCVTLSSDLTGSIITFTINPDDDDNSPCPSSQPLAERADYKLEISQTVRPLGRNMALNAFVRHKFNTGGGFEGIPGGVTVPGKPYVVSSNYVRTCYRDASNNEVHQARIEVRFNEDLAFAPIAEVQVTNDGSDNYQLMGMTQLQGGDMSIMKVDVPSVGGLQGYRIRFDDNFVRDLEGLFMNEWESSKMLQAFVNCI